MNITYEAFLKAARRRASRTGTTLAAAQSDLAADFGFKSLNAAQRAFKANGDALEAHELLIGSSPGKTKTVAAGNLAWMGFSQPVSYRLVASLVLRPRVSPEARTWAEKGLTLLRCVLPVIAEVSPNFTAEQLREALSLEWIESRSLESLKDRSTGGSAALLVRYLGYLPAYKIERLRAKHGISENGGLPGEQAPDQRKPKPVEQDSIAFDQHAYRLWPLSEALDALQALEQPGVLTDEVRAQIVALEPVNDATVIPAGVLQALEAQQFIM